MRLELGLDSSSYKYNYIIGKESFVRKMSFVVLLTAIFLGITGCATSGMTVRQAQQAIESGEWGTPETHTLLFGVTGADVHLSSELLQQNPQFGYKFVDPVAVETATVILVVPVGTSRFFIPPQPVGSQFKEFSWVSTTGTTTTTHYEGIGGVDIELSKPGLQFYGEDDENHTQELKTLEKMGKYFTGSSWELAILKRMEEISNGQ